MSDLAEIEEAILDLLGVDKNELKIEIPLETLPNFDSVQVLSLMVLLDDFGIKVSQKQIAGLKTYGDLMQIIQEGV